MATSDAPQSNDIKTTATNILSKSNVTFLIWFLAIYLISYFLIGFLFNRTEDTTNFNLKLSRTFDIIVLFILLIFILSIAVNASVSDANAIFKDIWTSIENYVNEPYSIFSLGFFILVFYTIIYLFRIPMTRETKPIVISVVENISWFLVIFIVFVGFFKYVLSTSLTDLIDKAIAAAAATPTPSISVTTAGVKSTEKGTVSTTVAGKGATGTAVPGTSAPGTGAPGTSAAVKNAAGNVPETTSWYDKYIAGKSAGEMPRKTSTTGGSAAATSGSAAATSGSAVNNQGNAVCSGSGWGPLNTSTPADYEVFNISKDIYTYADAADVCSAYGASLATYDQMESAYNDGAEWCNYGWSDGQMIFYPTQKSTWKKLQQSDTYKHACGRPGVNGGYIDNPYAKFGVNCFGKKPPPSADDLARMNADAINAVTQATVGPTLSAKAQDLKKNAAQMLPINSYNHKKWSEWL